MNFKINRTKIKGGCQSGRKVVAYNSKSDLPLGICYSYLSIYVLLFRLLGAFSMSLKNNPEMLLGHFLWISLYVLSVHFCQNFCNCNQNNASTLYYLQNE